MPTDPPNSVVDLPSPVRTADDFVAELRQLRVRAGNPSFRQLSRIADQRMAGAAGDSRPDPLPPSTTSEVLSGKRLPRLPRIEFVESYVAACLNASRLDEADIAAEVARWRTVWCTLAEPESPDEVVAERRGLALPLVAVVFLAGIGAGAGGTLGWQVWHRPPAAAAPAPEPPDVCVPAGTADPAGTDVLNRAAGSWWANDTQSASLDDDGHRLRADVTKGTDSPGDIVIVKSGVELVQGRSYALAFTALADRATTIRVRVQDSPPTYQESYTRDLPVDMTACRHVYRFAAARSSARSELTFQVGGHPEDFRLDVTDVVLVAVP